MGSILNPDTEIVMAVRVSFVNAHDVAVSPRVVYLVTESGQYVPLRGVLTAVKMCASEPPINAIKVVNQLLGLGLRNAKDCVDFARALLSVKDDL